MYKRLFYAALATLAFTLVFSAFVVMNAYADRPITVYVDGKKVEFPDAQPQMIDGRIFVPIRFVSEALGATVERDAAADSVIITSATQPCEPVSEETKQKQATIGEVVEFSSAKVKVTGVKYEPSNDDQYKYFRIDLDVFIDQKPANNIEWVAGQFVGDLLLVDGRNIPAGTTPLTADNKVKIGEWSSVYVYPKLMHDDEVTAITIRDPINIDETALIQVQ